VCDVDDPVFRLYSRLKLAPFTRACAKVLFKGRRTPRAVQRLQGKFTKLATDLEEPKRTERLLAHPFALFKSRASDMEEAMTFWLFPRVSGRTFLGLTFAWSSMLVQVTVSVLSGLGPHLDQRRWPASAQVGSVASIKLVWCAVLVICNPCACGVGNATVALQFMIEGVSALLLLLASSEGGGRLQADAITVTSYLVLAAPSFPMFQKLYDGVVVQIIVNCCRKRFDATMAAASLLTVLAALPKYVMGVFGLSGGQDAAEGAGLSSRLGGAGATSKAILNEVKKQRQASKRHLTTGA